MKKPVITISSHVARGSVGNRAAVFALEVRGHPVWAVPTVTLPFHPGHGKATRIVPDSSDFAGLLDDLASSRWIGEIGGILTGYMASAEQVEGVSLFVERVRRNNPDLIHVCDPVMGDGFFGTTGRLYIGEDAAVAMRDHLVPLADIVTPNRFELSWLTEIQVHSHDDARKAAKALGSNKVLVTSMPGFMKGNIGNFLLTGDLAVFAEHRELNNPPNGPGDLTSALFLSHSLDEVPPEKALQHTTASVFEIVAGAAKRGADELMLETDAAAISRPMAMVQIRNVIETQQPRGHKRQVFKPTSL